MTHKRTHTGEKPHTCEQCGRDYTDKRALKRHKRTHTGEKPHKCEQCGKDFVGKCQLVAHKRTHTGQKPYDFYYISRGPIEHCPNCSSLLCPTRTSFNITTLLITSICPECDLTIYINPNLPDQANGDPGGRNEEEGSKQRQENTVKKKPTENNH